VFNPYNSARASWAFESLASQVILALANRHGSFLERREVHSRRFISEQLQDLLSTLLGNIERGREW
jgi:hypothetical protein